MYINSILNILNPELQTLLVLLGLLVAQYLGVVANGINHGTEQLVLLLGPDVQVSQVMNVQLFVEVGAEIIGNLVLEGHSFFVFSFWGQFFFGLFFLLRLSSLFLNLADVEDWADDALVDAIANYDGESEPDDRSGREDVKPPLEEPPSILIRLPVMNIRVIN